MDVCAECHCIWFDHAEAEKLSLQSEKMNEAARKGEPTTNPAFAEVISLSDDPMATLQAIVGLPVVGKGFSWSRAVVFLALFIAVLSFMVMGRLSWVASKLGFVPGDSLSGHGLSWITSAFLHGSPAHLFGNLYALVVFGPEVEEYIGTDLFLVFFFVAAATGNLFVWLLDPTRDFPHLGASGAIFALMTFYCFKFPNHQISFAKIFFYKGAQLVRIRFSVWIFFLVYAVFQTLSAVVDYGIGNFSVSHFSHLGGAIAGLVFLAWYRPEREASRRK